VTSPKQPTSRWSSHDANSRRWTKRVRCVLGLTRSRLPPAPRSWTIEGVSTLRKNQNARLHADRNGGGMLRQLTLPGPPVSRVVDVPQVPYVVAEPGCRRGRGVGAQAVPGKDRGGGSW
jgi:hypothetical protein